MVIKYLTRFEAIKRVECERETESSVYINGRRSSKVSSYERYHDSWAEAHAFLVTKQQYEIDSLRRKLEQANGKLGQLKGMTQPAEAA